LHCELTKDGAHKNDEQISSKKTTKEEGTFQRKLKKQISVIYTDNIVIQLRLK